MSQLVIVEAFTALPDTRHTQALCLALFTLSVTTGNRDFWRWETGFGPTMRNW